MAGKMAVWWAWQKVDLMVGMKESDLADCWAGYWVCKWVEWKAVHWVALLGN